MSRTLPSRFYVADPIELACEVMAARADDAAYQARRAIERAQLSAAAETPSAIPHRWLDFNSKRARIRALTAQARGVKRP